MIYLWSLISLGSKVNPASEEASSSAPLPRFLSLFSSLRYIFIICFSCSDWMVTWQPYVGLVTSPLASRRADTRHTERDGISKYTLRERCKVQGGELQSIQRVKYCGKREDERGEDKVVATERRENIELYC